MKDKKISIDEIKRQLNCKDILDHFGIPYNNKHINCPFSSHEDKNPSFTLYENNARFQCFGCKENGDCIDLYKKLSGIIENRDALKELCKLAGIDNYSEYRKNNSKIKTFRYDYRDIKGELIFQVVRSEEEGKKKTFKMRRPNPLQKEQWIYSIKELPDESKNLPYRLNQWIDKESELFFICEGEKKVDFICDKLNFFATCNAGGAGKWTHFHSKYIFMESNRQTVIILPDNDLPGLEHSRKVAISLWKSNVTKIKIVNLPGLPEKGDIIDWYNLFKERHPYKNDPELYNLMKKELIEIVNKSSFLTENDIKKFSNEDQSFNSLSEHTSPPADSYKNLYSCECDIKTTIRDIIDIKGLNSVKRNDMIKQKAIQYLENIGEFYNSTDENGDDSPKLLFFDNKRKELFDISSKEFQYSFLASLINFNPRDKFFDIIYEQCKQVAYSVNNRVYVFKYWTRKGNAVYISNGQGEMVKITPGKCEIVNNGTDSLVFLPKDSLPEFTLKENHILNPFTELDIFNSLHFEKGYEYDKCLLKIWFLSIPFFAETVKPILVLSGNIRSGKTTLAKAFFKLFGIPEKILAVANTNKSQEDFYVQMNSGGLVCFDNLDYEINWFSNLLSSAVSNSNIIKRKLYTDKDTTVLKLNAWPIITSVYSYFASDPALTDRCLIIRLASRDANNVKPVEFLMRDIERQRDKIMSWFCYTLADIMQQNPQEHYPVNARNPEFSEFAIKCAYAFNEIEESKQALLASEKEKEDFHLRHIERDEIYILREYLNEYDSIEGGAKDIVDKLTTFSNGKLNISSKRLGQIFSMETQTLNMFCSIRKIPKGGNRTYYQIEKKPIREKIV